jgi:hypothetical protein
MPIEATFRELAASLQKLNDVVNALHITLEDKPQNDEAAVADDMTDQTLGLLGMVHDAHRAALRARHSLKHPVDLDNARRSLTACQKQFHTIEQSYLGNLVSYEKLRELLRVGGRSKEWAGWAGSIKEGIEQCRVPLEAASQALAACWQELAERLGSMNISVKSVNVGQRISVPKSKTRALEIESVT